MTNLTDTTAEDTPDYEFEPAEHSHAKNLVQDEIESLADNAFLDIGDGSNEIDSIGWAEAIIERLITAGLTIPEDWATRPSPWHPTNTETPTDGPTP